MLLESYSYIYSTDLENQGMKFLFKKMPLTLYKFFSPLQNLEFTLSSLSTPSSAAASNHSSSSNSNSMQQSQDPSANLSSPDKLQDRLNSLLDNNKEPPKAELAKFVEVG